MKKIPYLKKFCEINYLNFDYAECFQILKKIMAPKKRQNVYIKQKKIDKTFLDRSDVCYSW